MFSEYETYAREMKGLMQSMEEKIAQEKNLRLEEKGELEHEAYMRVRERIHEIKGFVTRKYGEKICYEFCQRVGWNVHNGQYEWVEGIGAIDRSLVPLIQELNTKGFLTRACCSGLSSEHRENPISGYITFEELPSEKVNKLKKIAFRHHFFVYMKETLRTQGMKVIHREKHLAIYNEGENEEEIKIKWQRFYLAILEL